MNDYLPYIIFGLTAGSVYGISAMGLVLTYKTSGLFNFGHGAVCAAAAYVFYSARQQHGLPWPVAAFLAVIVFGAVAGLFLERVALLLAGVHTSYKIVGTVGILVGVQALAGLMFGTTSQVFMPFLPQSAVGHVGDVAISWDQVVDFVLAIVSAVALYVFFKRTRLGTAMRAVVDDAQLLDMMGTSPARVRRSAWMIGSVFAAASGVLFAASQQQLDVIVLSLLVVQAFGAAAIAKFRSLPMCLVGGLAVGLLQALVGKEVGTRQYLHGLDTNMPFIVLFIVLLVIPRGQLIEVGRQVKARATAASPFSPRTRAAGYAAMLAAALVVPQVVGAHLPLWITAMSQVVLFVSLALLVRTSGQISLCHIGFAAIGAAGFGHMVHDGVPWILAVLLGGLFAVPAGALIAIPAIRLSGLYLGLATLGFGILLGQYAYNQSWMFGFGQLNTGRPHFLSMTNDTHFYYLLLAIAVLAIGLVAVVERSRLGRLLRGLADSPVALTTLGTNVNVSRVLVFCLSTFLAGVSGATFASQFSAVNQASFNYVQSLVVLAVMAISGRRTITVAVVAPILIYVVPGYISDPKANLALQLGFGIAAVVAAALSQGSLARLFDGNAAANEERLLDPVFGAARPSPASSRSRTFRSPAAHRARSAAVTT
jgi:ABC-type branched-subunit amino acid transport system permease subunit